MDQDKDQPFVQNVFDVYYRTLVKSAFSYFSTKTYVVGTQKNRLNETVLLSTQNICSIDSEENIYNFTLKMFVLLNLSIIIL